MKQNCDRRDITLDNNALITFSNCSIKIGREEFFNEKSIIEDRYYYPESNMLKGNPNNSIIFEDIVVNSFKTRPYIKEITFHRNVSYGISATIFLLLIAGVVVVLIILKRKSINVVVEKTNAEGIARQARKDSIRTILKRYKKDEESSVV